MLLPLTSMVSPLSSRRIFTHISSGPNSIRTNLEVEYYGDAQTLGALASVIDSSGNGRNGSQPTSALQPVCVANVVNGKSVIRFDGINDIFSALVSISAQEIYYVLNGGSQSLRGIGTTNITSSSGRLGVLAPDASTWYSGDSNDLIALSEVNGITTQTRDGSVFQVSNGSSISASSISLLALGNSSPGGSFPYWDGDMAYMGLYSVANSPTNRATIISNLKSYYAL